MPEDLVVASFKIPIKLRNELDAKGGALGLPTRSSLLRLTVEHFLRNHAEGRLPSVYRENGRETTEMSSAPSNSAYVGERPLLDDDRKEKVTDAFSQNDGQRKKSREEIE